MMGFWNRRKPAEPVPERPATPVQRKPRILIAGEFSAGKTHLINGLVGVSVLPSNVTATALPPVWLVRGEPALIRVGFSGRGEPLADLSNVDLEKTQYCVMSNPAPVLTGMDIIDTPGNSDPNMAAEIWQRMLAFADVVIWCTNATQAWRQSEKAVWQAMPARLRQNATLVVTHADLLGSPAMTDRVLQRVQREAGTFFDHFLMASLLQREDLDRISAHLRMLSGTLRLDGAANALISDFAASVPVRSTTPAPEPARPAAAAALPEAADEVAEDLNQDIGPDALQDRAPGGARVLKLVRTRRREDGGSGNSPAARTGPAAPEPGRARLLWVELSKTVDQSDPESLLAAVDHLIARLDAQPAQTGTLNTVSASSAGHSGAAADVYE
ncbi:dynamin family protein [Pseudogemmobacter bohemicus]|uniref:dynamin family protein n=1 Tax=Pseudogemmobacter bohemicus TaxID=2250708 RepID=UPI000DD2D3FE|nr:dynamin family protein [Pseudogemmobacter bohemicus]